MNIKYMSKYIVITALFITTQIVANDAFSFDQFDDFDLPQVTINENKSFSDAFDSLVTDITTEDLSHIRSCTPTELIFNSIKAVNLPQVLDPSIYKKTLVPLDRNIFNYPNTLLVSYQFLAQQQFTTHLFINVTPRKNFRDSQDCIQGTRLDSYLNIRSKGLLTTLDNLLELISDEELKNKLKRLDTDKLLWAFEQAHLEERRLGVLGHYYKQISEKSYFQAKLPLYWMIRNLNYDKQYKDIMQQELGEFINNGTGDSFDENAFARKHFVFDALGLGNLRLTYNHIVWEGNNWHLDLGASLILPTDYQFARGLYGTYFFPSNKHPNLDLCNIASSILSGEAETKQVEKYFLSALDHLSSMLLQCNLGYNKHLGFDIIGTAFWQIIPDLSFNTQYCVELLLPKEEQRFFVPKNKGDFSEIYNALPQATTAEQQAKLIFLEARLNELLFPKVLDVKLFPGFIFHSTSCLQKTFRNWNFNIGTNSYYQTNEQINAFYGLKREAIDLLDIEKSLNETLVQFKVFGKIHRIFHTRRHHDISLSIWADGTLYNNSLGNDYSLGIAFDAKF